ncbi:hypothetical protein ACLBSV_30365, partial [Klebsiella pneumoniae]|uniref:hypothetical protein n=1 Tax=Klebsiella pneumoniae TaxID=573 RepID=UPI00396856DC
MVEDGHDRFSSERIRRVPGSFVGDIHHAATHGHGLDDLINRANGRDKTDQICATAKSVGTLLVGATAAHD